VGPVDENLSGTLGYHRCNTLAHLQLFLLPSSAGYNCHLDLDCGLVLDTHFFGFAPGSVVAVPVMYLAGTDLDSGIDLEVGIDLAVGSVVGTDLAVGSDLEVGTGLAGSTHVPCFHILVHDLDHCY